MYIACIFCGDVGYNHTMSHELMDNIRERALATREHEAGNQEGVSSRRCLLCVTNSRADLLEVVSEATRVGFGPA